MNRIFICGDTHGTLDTGKLESLRMTQKLDDGDYLIICGDCGVVWSKEYVNKYIGYYERMKCNILFIDGNHENFDLLNEYKVEMWNGGKIHRISDKIIHLMRGQVFNILGITFFTLGGADSSDKEYRTEHKTWWEDERITFNDIEEAKKNLEKVNYKVDYVITHTPSTTILNELVSLLTQCGEAVPYYLENKVKATNSSDMLDKLTGKIKYKKWFCGHIHIDERLKNTQILYNNVIELK